MKPLVELILCGEASYIDGKWWRVAETWEIPKIGVEVTVGAMAMIGKRDPGEVFKPTLLETGTIESEAGYGARVQPITRLVRTEPREARKVGLVDDWEYIMVCCDE